VTCKLLLSIGLKVTLAVIDDDRVVHGLPNEILTVRVQGRCWNCMHVGLADVLCDHWNAELPDVDLLVVGSRDKSATVFDESDRVDRA